MESHIQAWFTINPEHELKEKRILAVYEDDWQVDLEDFTLGRSQVLVQVKRTGSSTKTRSSEWFHLAVHDATRAKIREWIANEETFDPAVVDIGDDEALVVVKGECCALTSSGHA